MAQLPKNDYAIKFQILEPIPCKGLVFFCILSYFSYSTATCKLIFTVFRQIFLGLRMDGIRYGRKNIKRRYTMIYFLNTTIPYTIAPSKAKCTVLLKYSILYGGLYLYRVYLQSYKLWRITNYQPILCFLMVWLNLTYHTVYTLAKKSPIWVVGN